MNREETAAYVAGLLAGSLKQMELSAAGGPGRGKIACEWFIPPNRLLKPGKRRRIMDYIVWFRGKRPADAAAPARYG